MFTSLNRQLLGSSNSGQSAHRERVVDGGEEFFQFEAFFCEVVTVEVDYELLIPDRETSDCPSQSSYALLTKRTT